MSLSKSKRRELKGYITIEEYIEDEEYAVDFLEGKTDECIEILARWISTMPGHKNISVIYFTFFNLLSPIKEIKFPILVIETDGYNSITFCDSNQNKYLLRLCIDIFSSKLKYEVKRIDGEEDIFDGEYVHYYLNFDFCLKRFQLKKIIFISSYKREKYVVDFGYDDDKKSTKISTCNVSNELEVSSETILSDYDISYIINCLEEIDLNESPVYDAFVLTKKISQMDEFPENIKVTSKLGVDVVSEIDISNGSVSSYTHSINGKYGGKCVLRELYYLGDGIVHGGCPTFSQFITEHSD